MYKRFNGVWQCSESVRLDWEKVDALDLCLNS